MSEQSVSPQFIQFAGLVIPNLPRNFRPERLKHYTEDGHIELRDKLRAAFADDLQEDGQLSSREQTRKLAEASRIELLSTQIAVPHTAEESVVIFQWLDHWKLFCKEFKLKQEIDFEAAKEKALTRPKGFDWVIYTPSEFTSREALDRLCASQFTVRETNPVQSYSLERQPDKARLILCRPNIESDTEWRVSSNAMVATALPFLDCRECYILEGFYYNLTKKHLNIRGWTRCPRSRSWRLVVGVYWGEAGAEFYADGGSPDGDSPSGGGREAVFLET